MAANNPWEMSWKEDTASTKGEQGSSPWTMNCGDSLKTTSKRSVNERPICTTTVR